MSFELINSHVVTGSQTSILFNNIPQDKTDLFILCSLRSSVAGIYHDMELDFNGESAREWRGAYALSATPASNTLTSRNIIGPAAGATTNANGFSVIEIYVPNYTSSAQKILSSTGISENFSTTQFNLSIAANSITNSTAVTSMTFSGTTLVQGSSIYLYGITAGSDGTTVVS